jgi:hypothetical protein
VTIVYGSVAPPDTIHLGSDSSVTRIYAEVGSDGFPSALVAPDIDGDGASDVLVGATLASPAGRTDAGKAYLIHGLPVATSIDTWKGSGFYLQSFPNPFNPVTYIVLRLDRAATANLSVYDVRGALVRTLVDGPLSAGEHRLVWDGADRMGNPVASGVYFCRLTTSSFVGSRKLVVVR